MREVVGDGVTRLAGSGSMAELRVLTPDDWELWREVRLAALADAPEAFGATYEYWAGEGDVEARWRSRLRDVPFNVVSMDGDRPTGQVSGTSPDAEGRVELISMWVAPTARGKGLGDALVAAVVEWAREQDASAVHLGVRQGNEPAIGLYERAGFEAASEPVDGCDVAMERPLR